MINPNNLLVLVVPTESDNGIDQRSSIEDVLACRECNTYTLGDYFQAQNDEDLPMHWSFLIDATTQKEYTGSTIID